MIINYLQNNNLHPDLQKLRHTSLATGTTKWLKNMDPARMASSGNVYYPNRRAVSCKFLPMRKLIYYAMFLLLFVSCKNTKFNEIEFIAYTYRPTYLDSTENGANWKMICPFYMHIDNNFNCQLLKGATYSDSISYLCESKDDPALNKIIEDIINKSQTLSTETDFRPSRSVLYDGSDLKIRIIRNNGNQVIHFWQDQKESKIFEKLYYYSLALVENSEKEVIDSSVEIKKQEFIKFVLKSDSTLRPLPPLAPKEVYPEYKPPKKSK